MPTLTHAQQFFAYFIVRPHLHPSPVNNAMSTNSLSQASNLLVAFAVYPVLETSPNFFSACVQLSAGIPLLLLGNWTIAMAIVLGKALQQLLFGDLELLEVERIYERSRIEVINSLFVLTIFSSYWLLIPGILTLVLLFVKVFHWLLNDRFEAQFQRATSPSSLLLTRNSLTLAILLFCDFTMVYSCADYTFGNTPDVYFAFGFEFALLFLKLMTLTVKIGLNTWELLYLNNNPDEEVMESKELYMKILKLTHTSLSLCIYFFLLYTFVSPTRFPLYLVKDIFTHSLSLVKQFKELKMHLKTAKELDSKLLDVTEAELSDDNNMCSICRDDMTTDGIVKGHRLFPKKLPCNHITHLGCLKAWLEISQVCPLCRAPVFLDNLPHQTEQARAEAAPPPPEPQPVARPEPPQSQLQPTRTQQSPAIGNVPHASGFEVTQSPITDISAGIPNPTADPWSTTLDLLTLPPNALRPPGWTLFRMTRSTAPGSNDETFTLNLGNGVEATLKKVHNHRRETNDTIPFNIREPVIEELD